MTSSGLLQAQTPEQRTRLLDLSARFSSDFATKKAEAIRWAEANDMPVRQEFEDGTVIELMFLSDNGMPMYYTTHNAEGATVLKSDIVYPGGGAGLSLTGSGQTLGIWDAGGVRLTHDELIGRVTQKDVPDGLHDHASHVAGTMIASGATAAAKGMSYAANLDAYDWDDDAAEMALAAANDEIRVSQHSYGLITGWQWYSNGSYFIWWGDRSISEVEDFNFGFYSDEASEWDEIAHQAIHYLIVKSAGNDRGQGPNPGTFHYIYDEDDGWLWVNTTRDKDGGSDGFDCVAHSATSKNVLTVGAVTGDGDMSSFSSWGPTDDGRIKPDIVAKGVAVYSSLATADNTYASWNGTSMSGPMVSGSIGLLLEHQENLHTGVALLSSTMKALVLHTAEDLGNPGPDYSFGWGLMDTEAAAAVMTAHAASPKHIFERTLNDGEEVKLLVKASGTDPLRATLAWTDVPGTPPTLSLNPTDLMLVNDLDMRITQLGGSTYEPFILDPANPANNATTGDNFRDNVEVVHIASPVADQLYEITINHKGSLSGGSQVYSLIVTGNKEVEEVYIAQSQDNASNYSGTWVNGDNEGYGFDAWVMLSEGTGGSYIGNTGLGDPTFGIYAGGGAGNYFVARRELHGPIAVGATIGFNLGYTAVANGGEIGVSFFAAGQFRFTLKFIGGDTEWKLNDGSSDFGTGISWSDGTPMIMSLTRGAGNKYSIVIDQGAQNFTGMDYTSNSGDFAIDRIEFFSTAQGSGENLGFNNLMIETDLTVIPANAAAKIIGKVQIDEDLIVNDLIIGAGNELAVKPGKNLTVNGNLHNFAGSDRFVLESDNSSTASLIHHSDDVPATMQRFIVGSANATTTQYHQVSVPLTSASDPKAELFTNAYLMYWNPVLDQWQWITDPDEVLDVYMGYMIWYTGVETTINFEGNLNNGSFTASLPFNAAGQHSLVPNPYPSAIDWDAAGWTKTNLDNAVYVWNRNINNYMGYGNNNISINEGSRYIAAGQAFVIAANAATAGLQMTNEVRVHNAIPFREGDVEPGTLRIKAIADGGQDESVVRLLEGATDNFDSHADLFKLRGGEQAPQLYSISTDNEELSVYSLPFTTEVVAIPLAFEMGVGGDVNFIVSGTESFEADATLILEDRLTGTYHSLRQNGNLVFNHEPANAPNRFFLYLFEPANVADQLLDNNATVWQAGNKLYIDHHEFSGQAGQISLFDMLGKKLTGLETSLDSPTVLDVSALKGPAVLHIRSNESTFSTKVVIN